MLIPDPEVATELGPAKAVSVKASIDDSLLGIEMVTAAKPAVAASDEDVGAIEDASSDNVLTVMYLAEHGVRFSEDGV